jgi:TetR/AcrR family tetracycline transcriptional repressor
MLPCTPYSSQVTSQQSSDDAERTRLTRAAVVDRALALADTAGLEALTIRKLATELGVTPMALYWHFRGKDELLNGLAERLWSEIDLNVDRSAPWAEQLRWLFTSLLTVLRTHPAAPQLLARHDIVKSEAGLNALEVALELLRTAGFSPSEASAVARSTLWTALTLVMSEPGIGTLDDAERTELQRVKAVTMATLPPSRYPRVIECAIPMTACDEPEEHYQFGVDVFIEGVAAIAAKRAAAGS